MHTVEQLADHCGNATEMPGAEFAIKHVLNGGRFDKVFLRLWVEILLAGGEQHSDASGAQLVAIGLESARVGIEIFVRAELQSIDKNRGHDGIAMRARLFHQTDVPGVEIAHRRHEYDLPAL